jgi:hypothetical protein
MPPTYAAHRGRFENQRDGNAVSVDSVAMQTCSLDSTAALRLTAAATSEEMTAMPLASLQPI